MSKSGRAGAKGSQDKAEPLPRPRRTVEGEYMAVLADAVPLARWRKIIDATADLAEKGDAKSREWLARYLLGEKPPSLLALAAEAAEGAPLGDHALLSELVQVRKAESHNLIFNRTEYGAAQRTLEGLVRPATGPALTGGREGEGGAAQVAPASPAPQPCALEDRRQISTEHLAE